MEVDFVSKSACSAERRDHRPSPVHAVACVTALRFTKRASLLLALLLSLGLWAGIWAAVASLASAMLG